MNELLNRLKNSVNLQILNKVETTLLEQYNFVPISVKDNYLFVVINSKSDKEVINLKLKEYFPQQVKFIQVPDQDLLDLLSVLKEEMKKEGVDDGTAKQVKLGELLVQKGYINDVQLLQALAESKRQKMPIGSTLFKLGFITLEQLKEILTLFSSGKFLDVINKYIMVEDKSQTPAQAPVPAPNIMFSTVAPVVQKPAPKYIFNLDLLEKMKEDKLSLQIISTILIFCLLKTNKMEETKTIFEKYIFNLNNSIFPITMLKAKYFIKNKSISKAIDIFSESIKNYTNYASNLEESKNNLDNIITIETYHQNFVYYKNIFNYLFACNDLDTKIKKLYYELKFCLNSLKFYSQSYQVILELYQKYPDDIQIIFELGKDSVTFSKLDKYQEMVLFSVKFCFAFS